MDKNKAKKITRSIIWGVFIVWNAALLFVVSKKQDPATIQQQKSQTEQVSQKPSETDSNLPQQSLIKAPVSSEFETSVARYNFHDAKLSITQLKNYKQNLIGDEKFQVINENDSIEIKWIGNTILPDANTPWKKTITENGIQFSWVNTENVMFIQKWKFDQNYGIKLFVEVINNSKKLITVIPSLHMKKKEFEKQQSFIFSGISLFAQNKLKNYKSTAIKPMQFSGSHNSWASFNEKYWLVAFNCENFSTIAIEKDDHFKISSNAKELEIAPQTQSHVNFNMFVGPKEANALKQFGDTNNLHNIENTIDYGWLFFLTKPVNYILKKLIEIFASIFWALIIITLLLKMITWPFTRSSHIAIKRIHQLNPAISDIKHRLKDNPELMNKEIFSLYKKYKINPVSGCLPSVLQMIFLFPLYKVLSFSIYLRYASFPGWIKDLSAADPTSWINLFGMLPFSAPEFLHIGAWPILMGISMFVQQKLSTSTPATTSDQKMMQFGLPVLFTWMMSNLSTGVVIYWTMTNTLTIAQILWIEYSEDKKSKKLGKK